MTLLPKEIEETLPPLYSTENIAINRTTHRKRLTAVWKNKRITMN